VPRCDCAGTPLISDSVSFRQKKVDCSLGVGQCLQIQATWPYNVRTLSELLRAISLSGVEGASTEQVG
jgi:hypothetical protein